ncbi:MAG: hypothetical protein F4121_08250, partial [Acidimicrobiia bacterium]|nr:hypothetical protein [Acidimicrobiia bacterium]
MTDTALRLGGRRSAPAVALLREVPVSAIVALSGLVLLATSAFLPWAVNVATGQAANAFERDLPWLVGGTDLAQQTAGSFGNGWILVGIVAVASVAGYPLFSGRRMVALPLAGIGAAGSLYV